MHQKTIFLFVAFVSLAGLYLAFTLNLKELSSRELQPSFLTTPAAVTSLIDQDILNKLTSLQNPANGCQNKLLVYDANVWPCGFGCQLHQIVSHLNLAFQTNRTLVVQNTNILSFFKPIGIHCPVDLRRVNSQNVSFIEDDIVYINSQDVHLKAQGYSKALIREMARSYSNKTAEPLAWLMGQYVNYVMRFNDRFEVEAARFAQEIGFEQNCVGVHVRRTDKKNEAKLYALSDYMRHVGFYFARNPDKPKCVYLITDEETVVAEEVLSFAEYQFIFSKDHAKFTPFHDNSLERLENILLDIYFITRCEYLVCTLSSNLGLLFYEISALKLTNLTEYIVSLDTDDSLKYRLT